MNLYVLPLGMDRGDARLGSLDFFGTDEIKTQMELDHFQLETIRTGASSNVTAKATVPELDLWVMNPPFVRSVGGNLLFGSLPDERGRMKTELTRRMRVNAINASVTAGLGSVFVALADRRLKKKGARLAFVVPAAIVSGEAWATTRKPIAGRYHLETVVASHDAERPSFSENADYSDILFIARKRDSKEGRGRTIFINLWRNPRSIHEAIDLANRIVHLQDLVTIEGVGLRQFLARAASLAR